MATDSPHRPHRPPALAGVAAAALALGVTEFVAGALLGAVSLVGAVGDAAIDWLPTPVIRFGIEAFGTDDKTVLVGVILGVCGVAGAVFARLGGRLPAVPLAGFAAFGLLGALAALRDPQARAWAVAVCAGAGAGAGTATLRLLVRLAGPPLSKPATRGGWGRGPHDARKATPRSFISVWPFLHHTHRDEPPGEEPGSTVPPGEEPASTEPPGEEPASTAQPIGVPDRRTFLVGAGAAAGLAVAAAALGRSFTRAAASAARMRYALPGVSRPVPPPPPAATVPVEGMTPVVVGNDDFYLIDTRLFGPPAVDVDGWRLKIKGMVDRPYELTFPELLDLPMVEEYVTLACVSNEVGGDLVGNAAWRGVPLAALLERAGIQQGATQIVGRAVDGFTVGFPTDVAVDGRQALVAVGMNGELLPTRHGFPARLVVAGLYGYTSATKWLEEIELTTWEGFDAYWIPRGWAKFAPVKTQSRIDVVRPDPVVAGPVVVAGVAWAPTQGIRRVEVKVDDEPWATAELAESLGDDSWRQWSFRWQATPGDHRLRVRATDGTGYTQTAEQSRPEPDGATGHDVRSVNVKEA